MKTIDWKTEYLGYKNDNIASSSHYYSVAGRKSAIGTREDPYPSTINVSTVSSAVLGNGDFDITYLNFVNPYVVGNSMSESKLKITYNTNTVFYGSYRNLTLKYLNAYNWNGSIIYVKNCILDNMEVLNDKGASNEPNKIKGGLIYNSIHRERSFATNISMQIVSNQCSFINITSGIPIYYTTRTGQALVVDTLVHIDQTLIDNNYTFYNAFNNCSFIIGAETESKPLIGNSADELRENFDARCKAQGLVCKLVSEFGQENTPMGRWVFSNTSIAGEYDTLENSEIDKFAKKRGIYFGHSNKTVKQVIITKDAKNIPESITSAFGTHRDVRINDNSIELLTGSSINKRMKAQAESKIIWLGGLRKLTQLNIAHNLPTLAGVAPSNISGLAATETTNIEAGKHYIIRSTDTNLATISYNNVEYTSSLITRNNVFIGVEGETEFADISKNSQVYQILNFANHQTIEIRLVHQLISSPKRSGSLQADYWYFVEPDNLDDLSASVTYNGTTYSAFDSFVAPNNTAITSDFERAHLRKCWKQEADFDNDPDKASWNGQKPYYFDVVTDDLRCMMKNDSSGSKELAIAENNKYIGIGHPDFYNKVNGITGIPSPAYDLVGSFMQIRVPITTTNLM